MKTNSPEPLFDEYSETYDDAMRKSIGFIGQSHDYFLERKVESLLNMLQQRIGHPKHLQLLDMGCGIGKVDTLLAPHVQRLVGADVSEASLRQARVRNPQLEYQGFDGRTLPFADQSFDAAFLICVLHHVPQGQRISLLQETLRVVRPKGLVLIYEHNPINPLTRLAVARCEFDRDAQLLGRRESVRCMQSAGARVVEQHYLLFSPVRLPGLGWVERRIRRLPLGAQYVVVGQKQ
jgi:ubiquinone/menaquinone biosynthesis C-methylase UbiE